MKYETAKNLNNTRFKRLIGVAKPVFDEMVKVLKAEYQVKHARGGRKPKLALKTCFLATLQYLKEYRTYEQIAADYGVHDSKPESEEATGPKRLWLSMALTLASKKSSQTMLS